MFDLGHWDELVYTQVMLLEPNGCRPLNRETETKQQKQLWVMRESTKRDQVAL